eukprot:10784056-Prorocentrum_lima.AAC.1
MTSSLVGSEMCIRDRSYSNEKRVKRCDDRLAIFVDRQKKETSPGNGPVSYTHLTLPTICSV